MVMDISERIRELREVIGITQSNLASALNISRSAVNAWEMGTSKPSIDTLVDLADFVERVEIVSNLDMPQLVENANRVIRILKDAKADKIDEQFLVEPIEKTLYEKVLNINTNVDYKKYLAELEDLNPAVTQFFNDVLVMDKDENVKNNRIALLTLLKSKYDHLTDFSKI